MSCSCFGGSAAKTKRASAHNGIEGMDLKSPFFFPPSFFGYKELKVLLTKSTEAQCNSFC